MDIPQLLKTMPKLISLEDFPRRVKLVNDIAAVIATS